MTPYDTYVMVSVGLLFGGCFGGLTYCLVQGLKEGADSYAEVYAVEAAREFENLFLFIPPQRIANIARLAALILFLALFLLSGSTASLLGIVRGLFAGGLGAGFALLLPRLALAYLRQRRLHRFNLQLVEALVSMSNALKAGFSILQSFEQVVREGQNPIAQEFGVFLQQTRIGVRFEDALENMNERVGSDDLTLVVRSIEIARQTGGNLTEVFERIAETIRERMRIEGRIRSLTAMGRLQGIVVGLMPIFLMFAMTLLDPPMMMAFFTSGTGIALLVTVLVLEVLGFVVIRKIVNINV